jgi:hypothetical protein
MATLNQIGYPDQIAVSPSGQLSGGVLGLGGVSSSNVTNAAPSGAAVPFGGAAGGGSGSDWFSQNAPSGAGATTSAAAAPYQGLVTPFSGLSASEFQQSPGFQFAMDQAMRAVQSSAAAKGTLLTGGTLKALQGYATGLANQDYQNAFQRALQTHQTQYNDLYNLANLGLGATENSYL